MWQHPDKCDSAYYNHVFESVRSSIFEGIYPPLQEQIGRHISEGFVQAQNTKFSSLLLHLVETSPSEPKLRSGLSVNEGRNGREKQHDNLDGDAGMGSF